MRRRRLLDAAWRCLERSSFLELTVDDVCDEAALSKGSFYGYFSSKRQLLYALVEDDAERLEQAAAGVPEEATTVERLHQYAEAALAAADDRARAQLAADAWSAAADDDELASRLRSAVDRRQLLVRGWIEQGTADGSLRAVPSDALASVLLALVDGLVLHHHLNPTAFRWANVRIAVRVLLDGVVAG